MVLIKNNHITAVGSITAAINRVRECDDRQRPLEVEVRTLDELREALALQPDRILLDNMSLDQLREAVQIASARVPRVPLEASGNVTLETVNAIAATGVDFISSGALTHSVKALDISLTL
jgi:nicotinate-nucleotide pyrophosphorylase (carboxylating)